MRQSMMCLEFRQGPRSIYGKNGHTGHTIRHDHGFASEFDNVDTAPRHTVHPNPKQKSRLFFLGGGVWKGDTPLQRRRFRLYFANAQGERDAAITGKTPSCCNPRLRRRFLGT